MNQPFRILIADDHAHAREGIREIIQDHDDFKVVGEAKNGREAIQLTADLMPDLILMDINMPELDGLEATLIIKNKYPYVKIVIITVSDDITDLFEALKKGAQGYLLKNLHPSTWYDYLRSFAHEEVAMSKELALQILQEFNSNKKTQIKESNPLSCREQEVLQLVAKGFSNKDIATTLNISEYTVKNHLKNIMHKLHLKNRVQLTRYAYEHGWISSE